MGYNYLETRLGKFKCQKWEWMRPKHHLLSRQQQNQLRKPQGWPMTTFISQMVIPLFHHSLLSPLDSTSSCSTLFQLCSMTFALLAWFQGSLQDLSKLFIRHDLSVASTPLPVTAPGGSFVLCLLQPRLSWLFLCPSSRGALLALVTPPTLETQAFPRLLFGSSFHDQIFVDNA